MARTRSKSNAEASVSATTATNSILAPHSSPLRPSGYPSTIQEEPSVTSIKSESVSPQSALLEQQRPWAGGHARISRLAATRALDQLRKRLTAIDEHSRELRNARHILIKREQASVRERDELVEFLRSVELAILAGEGGYPDRPADEDVDVVGDDLAAEFEPPSKRKALNDPASDARATIRKRPSNAGLPTTTTQTLAPLAPAPTLIQNCPPELLHPSTSLPRPPEDSPAPKTPQSSPKMSIRCNGIRFPPGSAPRLPRSQSRSSSPFTQMLPPPVPIPASPATPKPTKVYEPIIRDFDIVMFDSPSAPVPQHSSARALPNSPLGPMVTPDTQVAHPKSHNTTVPIYLLAHNPPASWEVTHLGPERTPSPPIGQNRLTWAPRARPEAKRRFVEPERSVPGVGIGSEDMFGPASRTRARVSNVGVSGGAIKGKGRA